MNRLVLILLLHMAAMSSQASLDLTSWDEMLASAVTEGQVDYRQWRDNPRFDALVNQIAEADVAGMSREEALVFYINAYNILAARGILDGSSPSSLLGRYVYFKRDKYTVAGESVNLYDLEHELIRPLGEARIHFAIVCASASCPILRNEAYTLEKQLPSALHSKEAVVILRLRGHDGIASTFIGVLERYVAQLQSGGGKLILSGVYRDAWELSLIHISEPTRRH